MLDDQEANKEQPQRKSHKQSWKWRTAVTVDNESRGIWSRFLVILTLRLIVPVQWWIGPKVIRAWAVGLAR